MLIGPADGICPSKKPSRSPPPAVFAAQGCPTCSAFGGTVSVDPAFLCSLDFFRSKGCPVPQGSSASGFSSPEFLVPWSLPV